MGQELHWWQGKKEDEARRGKVCTCPLPCTGKVPGGVISFKTSDVYTFMILFKLVYSGICKPIIWGNERFKSGSMFTHILKLHNMLYFTGVPGCNCAS